MSETTQELNPGADKAARSLNIVKNKGEFCEGLHFNFEGLKRIGNVLILHGWIVDPERKLASIVLGKPGAAKAVDLRTKMVRFSRPDVISAFNTPGANIHTHYGFAAVVEDVAKVSELPQVAVALIATNGNAYVESIRIIHLNNREDSLPYVAGIIPDNFLNADRCEKFYRPIFKAITSTSPVPVDARDEVFGRKLNEPVLSVIIPLYGETRFELVQIPAMAALRDSSWEIIFAVDDPRIVELVRANVNRLARLYDLTIRVVAPTQNLGFSGINNFAAAKARGKYLLFLNSDCFISDVAPIQKAMKWLAKSKTGAAGFRLTYADKTIQHDGMSVSAWNTDPAFLLNLHPRSGLPINLIPKYPSNDDASLLTAACLMVPTNVFNKVLGFDRDYIRGDFEDSDLCLKIAAAGLRLGIVREEGIFHLERQTIGDQEGGLRQKITLVNSFIYTSKWKSVIDAGLENLEVVA